MAGMDGWHKYTGVNVRIRMHDYLCFCFWPTKVPGGVLKLALVKFTDHKLADEDWRNGRNIEAILMNGPEAWVCVLTFVPPLPILVLMKCKICCWQASGSGSCGGSLLTQTMTRGLLGQRMRQKLLPRLLHFLPRNMNSFTGSRTTVSSQTHTQHTLFTAADTTHFMVQIVWAAATLSWAPMSTAIRK